MIALKGTEKQIKWAEDVRTEVVEKLMDTKKNYETMISDAEKEGRKYPKRYTKNIVALESLLSKVMETESAKVFIEDYRLLITKDMDVWEVADIARNRL